MPTYEFRCQKCQETFEVIMSMKEHGRRQVKCPHCNSKKVVQQFTVFYAKTGRKS
jgi:putative FmdB family regulatory protein